MSVVPKVFSNSEIRSSDIVKLIIFTSFSKILMRKTFEKIWNFRTYLEAKSEYAIQVFLLWMQDRTSVLNWKIFICYRSDHLGTGVIKKWSHRQDRGVNSFSFTSDIWWTLASAQIIAFICNWMSQICPKPQMRNLVSSLCSTSETKIYCAWYKIKK